MTDPTNEHPIAIEDAINFDEQKNYVDRYFTQKFQVDTGDGCNDLGLLIHSNRLCVVTLAPSHPIVKNKVKVKSVDFQVSKNVNRLNNKTSGKRKRNAQVLTKSAPICFIECEDNIHYAISAPMPGKLIEVNEKLSEYPEVLRLDYRKNYFQECYIAVIGPKHDVPIEKATEDLLSLEDYQKVVKNRTTDK